MGVDIDPTRQGLGHLSAGHRQLTEIVKATSQHAQGPGPRRADHGAVAERGRAGCSTIVRQLKAEGVAIVYVSHRMDEIFRIADRATILRDGRHVITAPLSELHARVDDRAHRRPPLERVLRRERARRATIGEPLLELRDVSGAAQAARRRPDVHRGEVVGVAGLLGSGRIVAGARALRHRAAWSAARSASTASRSRSTRPRDAIDAGIALIPEDRRRQGFVADHSVASNICLPVLDRLSRHPGS